MAIYVPTIQTEYVRLGLIDSSNPEVAADNRFFRAFGATGIMAFNPAGFERLGAGGDRITIPALIDPPLFTRMDHTSATPLTPATIDASTDIGVVCWDQASMAFKDSDNVRAGINADREWSMKIGGNQAKRAVERLMIVTNAAIDAVDSPASDAHTSNIFTGAGYTAGGANIVSPNAIQNARSKLGDQQVDLHTMVIHSVEYGNLLKEVMRLFPGLPVYQNEVLVTGAVPGILGLRNIIVYDGLPVTAATGTFGVKYNTFLFGSNALVWAFQRAMTINSQIDVLNPSTRMILKAEYAAVAHLRFVKWNSATNNPDDTTLGTTSNWDEGFDISTAQAIANEHKRVKCVKIVSG